MSDHENAKAATGLSYGVDLITFFDPHFWGVQTADELTALATRSPRAFWNTMLDSLKEASIDQIELTFAPCDYSTAIAAYGSTEAFIEALDERGLSVLSSYFGDIEHAENLDDAGVQASILANAERYAAFLARVGARYLVIGLPMRRNNAEGDGYVAVDFSVAAPIADLLNRLGAITARHGIVTALHTESHSVFWTSRDIDLFMLLTDPFLVSFCPDTGHIVLGGSDPVEVVRRHRDRVVLAHWKDATGPFEGYVTIDDAVFTRHREYFRPVGSGRIDWVAWSRALREIGFDECALLELDAAPDPVGQLVAARTFLEKALSEDLSTP